MQLKQMEKVDRAKLQQFLQQSEKEFVLFDEQPHASYCIEDDGEIISLCQLDVHTDGAGWLKKLFITRQQATKLPDVLQTIIRFAETKRAKQLYVHSKQPLTDLLLLSSSFTIDERSNVQHFNDEQTGTWWSITLTE